MNQNNKEEKDYISKDILSITQFIYPDGQVLYQVGNKSEEDGNWSEGMCDELEVLVHVMVAMGRITCPKFYNHD